MANREEGRGTSTVRTTSDILSEFYREIVSFSSAKLGVYMRVLSNSWTAGKGRGLSA